MLASVLEYEIETSSFEERTNRDMLTHLRQRAEITILIFETFRPKY